MSIQPAWQHTLDFFGTPIVVEPTAGLLTSDAGLLPFRQFDERIRLTQDFAAVLNDPQWRERYMPADSYEVSGIGLDDFARLLNQTRADGKAIAELLRAGGYRPK